MFSETPDSSNQIPPGYDDERFRIAFEHAPIGMAITAPDGRLLEVNPTLCRLLGYSAEQLSRRSFQELTHPDDLDANLAFLARVEAGELDAFEMHKRYLAADGRAIWTLLRVAVVRAPDRSFRYMLSQIQDLTAEHREHAFRSRLLELVDASLQGGLDEAFYQQVLDAAVEAIPGAQAGSLLLRDDADRFRFAAVVGHDFEALKRVYLLESELYQDPTAAGPHLVFDTGPQELEDEHARELWAEGSDLEVTLSIPVDSEGERVGYFNLDNFEARDAFSEASVEMARLFAGQVGTLLARLRLEAELRHLAFHDALTGLAARHLLLDRIERATLQSHRSKQPAALLMLDLDGFKEVNDRHGHALGDALLVAVAQRLQSMVRESDTAARLGGDEFVLLLTNLSRPLDGERVAERVMSVLREPYEVAGNRLRSPASLGLTTFLGRAASPEELLEQADVALYRAKRGGRNRYAIFAEAE